MLTEEEKAFLRAYSPKIAEAVRSLAGAIPVKDLERMAEIYRREVNGRYKLRGWCSGCKLDLLRKMDAYLKTL